MRLRARALLPIGLLAMGLTGCPTAPQPDVCQQYIECVFPADGDGPSDEVDAADRSVVIEYFGEDGQCWREADLVDECEAACVSAQEELCDNLPGNAPEACTQFCE
jgi:hypothetical protein